VVSAARSQIERQLGGLQTTQGRVRQEEITAEVVGLAAGETASRIATRRGGLDLHQGALRNEGKISIQHTAFT
jgi:hypothetical protein